MPLRVSVVVGAVFLAALSVSSLARARRVATAARTAAGTTRLRRAGAGLMLVALGVALQLAGRGPWAVVALDWLPGIYLLAGYWLPAQLPGPPAVGLQARLDATDRVLFDSGFARLLDRAPRLVLEYLEAAYLGCYLLVPAGLAWLYLAGRADQADRFWTGVLLAALPCYALVAAFETLPPRSTEAPSLSPWRQRLAMRRLNVAILERASIGLNTFPSGHSAASCAAALCVGAVLPSAGAVLGLLAVSIALGSVAGRYHYALDAALGMLAAVAAFAVSRLVA